MPGAGHGLDLDDHVPRRLRSEGSNKDVFCMVKAKMSDESLAQRPLLVYPESFLGVTKSFFDEINSCNTLSTAALEEACCAELSELADSIEKDFPHLGRGVSYLRSLTNAHRHRQPCPRLQFIDAGPSSSSGLADLQLGVDSSPLQVVFHHQRPG